MRFTHEPHREVERELKRLLVRHVCAVVDGWDQTYGGARLQITQPQLSRLRRGRSDGFSISRLLRMLACCHYDIEVHLRLNPRPCAQPRRLPTVTVVRYDRFGRPEGS